MKLFKKNLECIPENEEFEVCVLCGVLTNTRKSEPLERRVGYLPGAGQLCSECFRKNVSEEQTARDKDYVYALPIFEVRK